MKKLSRKFFEQKTVVVAKQLLGKIICRKLSDGTVLKGKIVETEAYTQEEESCHAYKGKTKRAEVLFRQAGTLYVYFIYGMYYCSNIVTEHEGYGSAVLLRAIEPLNISADVKKASGPAKLCKYLSVTKELNGIDITDKNSVIWIEDAENIAEEEIVQTVRIGITKAKELPWRFYIRNGKCVSKK